MLGLIESAFDLLALTPDGVDLRLELVLGPTLLGRQIEEVVLLAIESAEAPGVLLAQSVTQLVVAVCGGVYACLHLGQPLGGQGDGIAVVGRHGVFQDLDGHEREVADALLTASAEEVEVLPAALADSSLNDQAMVAASAVQQALQVVIVGALSGA